MQSQSYTISSQGSVVVSVRVLRAHWLDGMMAEEDYNDAQVIANNLDLYDTWWYQEGVVSQVHAIRPELKVIVYRNVRALYNTNDHPEWLLKTVDGQFIYNRGYPNSYFLTDIGNPDYQDFVVNWIKEYCDKGFDGVFADYGVDTGAALTYGLVGTAINPRTGEPYTASEWVDDTITLVKKIKSKIGSKLFVGNGIHCGDKWLAYKSLYQRYFDLPIDGFMSEGFLRMDYSEASWKNSIDFMVWVQDNFLSKRSNGIFIPFCSISGDEEASAKYFFTSCLLGTKDFSKNYYLLHATMLSNHTQNLFKIDLGAPNGDYYVISGTHVYARDFTKAKILVNPTSTTYTVDVNGEAVTMYPRSGEIVELT